MGALAIANGVACQRQQGIALQSVLRRAAEDMQPIAYLAFLELAQIGIGLVEQELLVLFRSRCGQPQVLVQVVGHDVLQNLLAQQLGTPPVQRHRFVVLVHHALQITCRAIAFGPRQRRHQMVDDDGLGTALGLRSLTRIVDDEGVEMRHGPKDQIWPAGLRQGHAFPRQPLHIAVLAHMHKGICGPRAAQPEVKRQVVVRRHQIGVVVAGHGIKLVAARRLYAHKHLP